MSEVTREDRIIELIERIEVKIDALSQIDEEKLTTREKMMLFSLAMEVTGIGLSLRSINSGETEINQEIYEEVKSFEEKSDKFLKDIDQNG